MKKIFFALIMCVLISTGCGEKKTLHCDACGDEIIVDANDKMEEDWIVYCESCNKELFGDDPLLNPNE